MKKKIIGIIVAIVVGIAALIGAIVGVVSYSDSNTNISTNYDYYGCPNSSRVNKLNTRKDRKRV